MNYLLIFIERTAVRSTWFQLVTIMVESCLSPFKNLFSDVFRNNKNRYFNDIII